MPQFINSLSETVGRHVPSVISALVVFILGLILASLLRSGLRRLLNRFNLDARVKEKSGGDLPLTGFLTTVVFYLVVLYAALIALGILGIEGVLDPAKQMMAKTLDIIPNVVAAVLIGVIGLIVARIVSGAVRLLTTGLDRFAPQAGVGEGFKPSALLGTVVFVLIFVPVLVSALDALKIEAISRPAIDMLQALLAAVPKILGALVILGVAFTVGRFVAGVVSNILENAGANSWAEKTGAGRIFGERGLSGVAGNLVLFFIMLGALLSAVETLDLEQLSSVLDGLLSFAGQVVVGLLIIAVGVWLANVAYVRLHKEGEPRTLASIARVAVLGFVLSFGLQAMGIGDDIVNLAFGLTLGAVAVAVALSFGLGGREAAGRQMEHWLSKWRGES